MIDDRGENDQRKKKNILERKKQKKKNEKNLHQFLFLLRKVIKLHPKNLKTQPKKVVIQRVTNNT